MSRRPHLRLPPIPLLVFSAASIQGGAALAKELFPALGPTGTSGVRLAFASLILLAVFRPRLRGLGGAAWKALIPYGVSLGFMNLTFYEALARIPLGLAVTLEFVGPLGVAVFGSRRAIDFLWVLLAAAGIVLLAPLPGSAGELDPLGVTLALVAGACWGAYIIAGGKVSRLLPTGDAISAGMLIATAVVLPFGLATGAASKMTPGLVGLGLVVALLSSALPYTIEMLALRSLPGRTFGILMSIEPVMATLMGMIFLGELLFPTQWIAVACVSLASLGSSLSVSDRGSGENRDSAISPG